MPWPVGWKNEIVAICRQSPYVVAGSDSTSDAQNPNSDLKSSFIRRKTLSTFTQGGLRDRRFEICKREDP